MNTAVLKGKQNINVTISRANQPLNFWVGIPRGRTIPAIVTDEAGLQKWRDTGSIKKLAYWYMTKWTASNAYLQFRIHPDASRVVLLLINFGTKPMKIEYAMSGDVANAHTRFAPSLGGGAVGWLVGGPIGAAVGALFFGSSVRDR